MASAKPENINGRVCAQEKEAEKTRHPDFKGNKGAKRKTIRNDVKLKKKGSDLSRERGFLPLSEREGSTTVRERGLSEGGAAYV